MEMLKSERICFELPAIGKLIMCNQNIITVANLHLTRMILLFITKKGSL